MIEIRNGVYDYKDFRLAIALKINKGEFCAVLGPSGSGKSTLLNIIAGFEKLTQGELLLEGKPAAQSPADRPISMIFQDHNVFPHLNVWTNVALGISPSLQFTPDEEASIDLALGQVGLQKLKLKSPGEISGGERQRIALARVLVRNRPILLLDEPFAALDPGLRRDMLNIVAEIQTERSLTVLLVTHQPEDAKKVAQKIVFIDGGKVNDAITTDNFFANKSRNLQSYLGH